MPKANAPAVPEALVLKKLSEEFPAMLREG
jgi:hypothetical protein